MNKIIETAQNEIGVKEHPPGSNCVKYNDWFYGTEVRGSSYPWCGAFVSWVFNEAGSPLGTIDFRRGFAGCRYATQNIKKWGVQVTVPQPGDVVFFDWDGNGVFDHTGIFVRDLGGGYFESIEGNTSFKNNSNGGEGMRRADRRYKNAIFVRPNVVKQAE